MRISTGRSRKDLRWAVEDISWEDLCKRLSSPHRTTETLNEYKSMKKAQKDEKKDVGGFVGGVIEGGRRTSRNIKNRTLITLDADYAKAGMWNDITLLYNYTMCCYSTHSHTPKAPRLRLVLPLDREVTVEEYEPIARMVAKDFGIEQFDVTTYEAGRLMYWPSASSDGEFVFEQFDGELLSADKTLARYKDWRNSVEWPLADREQSVQVKRMKAQGDPEAKPGIVGLFCRAYDVESAIEAFLSDVYTSCDEPGRYTYAPGSTSSGVVIYGDGQFSYSHHATDPAGGTLCNSFDLVRLHKFGGLDADADPDLPINRKPSYVAMQEFAANLDTLKKEKLAEIQKDFTEEPWSELPEVGRNGEILVTQPNIEIILRNDPNLKGRIKINELTQRLVLVDHLPWQTCTDPINGSAWSDVDDAGLYSYLQRTYNIRNPQMTDHALKVVTNEESFHPVRNYLNGLEWDGIPRAETVFVDWLGAEDEIYTRAVTKKWLVAAVARIMQPGCKFDNMIVLVGDQGIGKSLLAKKLGKHWFSDTFGTMSGKEGLEQLRGFWIIEMGELSAMRRSDAESVKHFISKQEDAYRPAYGRHIMIFPRQCVFYGSTNETDFLKDRSGNRRFWPIPVKQTDKVFAIQDDTIDQIWAEAVQIYRAGEKLYLGHKLERLAIEKQDAYMEDNPKLGMIEEYLDKALPANWEEMNIGERRDFIGGYYIPTAALTYKRDTVCIQEIMVELFGLDVSIVPAYTIKEFHSLMRSLKNWKRAGGRKPTVYGKQIIYERVGECS